AFASGSVTVLLGMEWATGRRSLPDSRRGRFVSEETIRAGPISGITPYASNLTIGGTTPAARGGISVHTGGRLTGRAVHAQDGVGLGPESSELVGQGRRRLGHGPVGPSLLVALLGGSNLAQVMLADRQEDPPLRPVRGVRVRGDGGLERRDGLG